MAGTSLLALLDDIASVLDDVATLTQAATKKTAGVLGDDLALNAQQVTGVRPERELPVVWAVARGSALNKVLLVPAALAISHFAPWAVAPLLMLGGAFLCFEGAEKLGHALGMGADDAGHDAKLHAALADPTIDLVAFEREKIRGAIRTDFVLSAEIVTIALGTVADAPLLTRLSVLVAISAVMTVGVYGLVAGLVKLDDLGLHLTTRAAARGEGPSLGRALGRALVRATPPLMRTLSVVGTAAMFLVGGGILVHGVAPLHHWVEGLSDRALALPWAGGLAAWLVVPVVQGALGVAAGALLVLGLRALQWVRKR